MFSIKPNKAAISLKLHHTQKMATLKPQPRK